MYTESQTKDKRDRSSSLSTLRFLCPTGHLGFAPLHPESFALGVSERPDAIIADSGSCDVGPAPLGGDSSTSPVQWQRHDLEHMLLAARSLGVPMIIGSAGDTGADSRVDLFVELIKDIAAEHDLAPFKLGYFYSEVALDDLRQRLKSGQAIHGLDRRPPLKLDDLEQTNHVVALAAAEPYMQLLDAGADVIIGGRSSDSALFAAPALRAGFPTELSYCLGKLLECASFCAEPYAGKESVLGEISESDVKMTAMHPDQRCTPASVSGHAMYERSNPFYETVLGGVLDLSNCQYEQWAERTCRVTGPQFQPSDPLTVKLEGAGWVGERYFGFAAIRDPNSIARIDEMIAWARRQVVNTFGESGYELYYHVYGANGVMQGLEQTTVRPHEIGVAVEAIAATAEKASEVCMIGTRQLFYARIPELKGTAGAVAFLFDEPLRAQGAYRWTVNHVMEVDDPLSLFRLHTMDVNG